MTRKPKKILVPTPVSLIVRGEAGGKVVSFKTRPGGTKAFVEKGVKMPKGLSPREQVYWLKRIAHGSEYFIKPLSPKAKEIRSLLEKNGIIVEKAIQDLKNGTFLFKKTGNSLDSVNGIKLFIQNREKNIENVGRVIRKMHSLGITHNHLHLSNIAITNNGTVVLLDFKKARISKKTITIGEGIFQELLKTAKTITKLENHVKKLSKPEQQKREREILLQFLKNYPKEITLTP